MERRAVRRWRRWRIKKTEMRLGSESEVFWLLPASAAHRERESGRVSPHSQERGIE